MKQYEKVNRGQAPTSFGPTADFIVKDRLSPAGFAASRQRGLCLR